MRMILKDIQNIQSIVLSIIFDTVFLIIFIFRNMNLHKNLQSSYHDVLRVSFRINIINQSVFLRL